MMPPAPISGADGAGDPARRPASIRVLSAADHDLFVRAFAAGRQGRLDRRADAGRPGPGHRGAAIAAMALCPGQQQRRQLRRYRRGDEDRRADLAAERHAACPGRSGDHAGHDAGRRSSPGSAAATPNSSIGRIRLGEALVATGQTAKGGALIRAGWAEGSFDDRHRTGDRAEGRRLSHARKRPRPAGQSALARTRPPPRGGELPRVDAADRRHRPGPHRAGRRPAGGAKPRWPRCADSHDPALLYRLGAALRAGPPGRRRPRHADAGRAAPRWRAIIPRAGGPK